MNPWLALILLTGGIVGGIALGACLGHYFAKRIAKRQNKTFIGRALCSWQFWSILAGLLMCSAILSSSVHFILAFAMMCPMAFALLVAEELCPEPKVCKCCGH